MFHKTPYPTILLVVPYYILSNALSGYSLARRKLLGGGSRPMEIHSMLHISTALSIFWVRLRGLLRLIYFVLMPPSYNMMFWTQRLQHDVALLSFIESCLLLMSLSTLVTLVCFTNVWDMQHADECLVSQYPCWYDSHHMVLGTLTRYFLRKSQHEATLGAVHFNSSRHCTLIFTAKFPRLP